MSDSHQVMSGNELIIQGGLEAGFSLYTGYPGSPLADYFNILNHQKKELESRGIRVVIGNSEANAAAMASGAKQAGRDVCVAMKSMGLHVASDALSVGNFANPGPRELCSNTGEELSPGVVIVVGDDPWSQSTSTPADSRYLYKHLHIPFLEPSTPQELKDWMKHALTISKKSSIYQGVLLNTFIAEGGGRVKVNEAKEISKELVDLNPDEFDLSKNVMVPPNSLKADQSMIVERFPRVEKALKELNLDKVFGQKKCNVGIISAGVIFESVKEVCEENNLLEQISLYKLACSYPLVKENILDWANELDHIIVIEEKRGFLETELSQILGGKKIYGKKFILGEDVVEGFPSYGGLNPEIISSKLGQVFQYLSPSTLSVSRYESCVDSITGLPMRLPTFCPGCPHRETLSLLKELRKDLKKKGVNLISHGDVGCYSLSFLEPFKEMHNLSAMGQGGALGAGVDLFTKNPSVVLMGDSTFFHSGLTDISNSVQASHDITYILLDNDNTAMTGHQMTPASGVSVEGEKRPRQKMLDVVNSLGVDEAIEVNPSDRYFYKNLLSEMIQKKGTKVIVSNKECGLTFHGRKKREERALLENQTISEKSFFQINSDLCEHCLACVEMTGCPGLSLTEDAYGQKVFIDPQICVADSYCTKIKACPSFEEIIVKDYHPTKYKKDSGIESTDGDFSKPEPLVSIDSLLSEGKTWRAVVIGVGGTGVTTISRVIAEASKNIKSDLIDFKFMDQKGLAQRNGRVTGHLALHPAEISAGTVTPTGKADLILSPDLLDASSALHYLSANGHAIIDDEYQIPLSFLLSEEEFSRNELQQKVFNSGENIGIFPANKIAVEYLGKSVYSSCVLLGMAYQKGLLPFSEGELTSAIERSMKKTEVENNLTAFNLGRKFILAPKEFTTISSRGSQNHEVSQNLFLLEQSIVESFPKWNSTKEILGKYKRANKRLRDHFPDIREDYLAQFIHDQMIYDRGKNLEDFIKNAGLISTLVEKSHHQTALQVLAKTYFVKDEVFCAHQMISAKKTKHDENQYQKLGKSYEVKRINRPHFDIFGKEIEFDLSPSTWMLKVMRHLRVLRLLMPSWHQKERAINKTMRESLMTNLENTEKLGPLLKNLKNIKGYREVRYEKAEQLLGRH